MYILVVVQARRDYYEQGLSTATGLTKVRLERAAGEPCLVVSYQEFSLNLVNALKPRAVVMNGFGKHFQSRKVASFYGMDEVLHHADLPILGICGSHQLMGFSFASDLRKIKRLADQPMRKLTGRDADVPRKGQGSPDYDLSGDYVADGFFPVQRIKEDPLFRGLPKTMLMRCAHYCEVKELPPGFVRLASSAHCRIEAMRHRDRPLYGVQFHPEKYEAPFFHGRRLLENFAEIVNRFWRDRR
ncbi:MAG: gamma-glutamyl-gamma-aminobutyrate hydrolase family protein [Verrucomicrobia bacterium]|nr:gamma-glutamyl-gamma-aminobutyrate hydrolase family protein [Verrucomicrobiota bacterium]MCG2681065.1 gamma-glutamyl-gamma-aminobutyrate hydrolase family protein [Kiritimatiellia bacterium]MBU4248294.1 gamma-glutamyl-gamma-aminobutyrate hydrolase family protein [Verrucomicrobiota bacterium]MBU4290488.1 gamma-glutamyl-gamma-aminobutyrate hydrolase family protein [Verrucomicrobiota bacterium]MBU4427871.1 gamma-glutamyl-gamma-aminobutyrate hydrolase family protein [Verrucomicrobiota bacterium]